LETFSARPTGKELLEELQHYIVGAHIGSPFISSMKATASATVRSFVE
jgi:hypothetical protein